MKLFRAFCVALLPGLFSTAIMAGPTTNDLNLVTSFLTPSDRPIASEMCSAAEYYSKYGEPTASEPSSDVGIKEVVPDEYRDRYQKWKAEMLATDFGRQQWDLYANSKHFLLKIVVSPDKKYGAGTGEYKWDDNGKLIGATITLGKNLDRGYPDPVYYPVMNSLSGFSRPDEADGTLLASTKFAHEFGHVVSTAQADGHVFQQQDKLMASYYKIFLDNGYDTSDPRLVKLAGELGRQPIQIWEDREYWGEANAMRYLMGRINKQFFFCSVLGHIMRNVNEYASGYEDRFDQIAGSAPAGCRR